jgi:3-hydroxyisobutyrate dehydrogenase/2-hydroxy-3-oxopropionate reductase
VISRIAFLGTGLMGAPMVARLVAAGFEVRAWNRSPGKLAPLIGIGAAPAASPGEAVADAQLVCFCLTDGNAIEEMLFGSGELAKAIPTGALLIDFSTIGPKATRALAARLEAGRADLEWIDAPVSGGVRGAETGELVVMCGGGEHAVAAVRPVLSILAKRIGHLGPLGSGQAAKLCNQLIVSANIAAITEALILGREQGLDIAALPEALAGGWADSLPLQIIGSRMGAGCLEPPIVSIGTYVKDLALVLESAEQPPELALKTAEIFAAAAADGQGGADVTALIDRISRRDQ